MPAARHVSVRVQLLGRGGRIELTLCYSYEHADELVGVYREQVQNSSQALSLDLSKVSAGRGGRVGSICSS